MPSPVRHEALPARLQVLPRSDVYRQRGLGHIVMVSEEEDEDEGLSLGQREQRRALAHLPHKLDPEHIVAWPAMGFLGHVQGCPAVSDII